MIPGCASSSPAFLMMYSAYKLNKQGDTIKPWHTPFLNWSQSVVPCPVLTVAVEELEGFNQILKMYLLHSWWRLEAETSITKGYERSLSAQGWERITKGYMPGLEAFEVFLLTSCFWEQGLLFHDKTPFRVSPKLCYGLGGGNCILCLNALMFYRERLHASLLYALLPETIYLQKDG